MHPALQGAIVGLVIGLFMYFFEVSMLKKGAAERAKKYHKKAELDPTERKRIATVLRWVWFLPILFGAGFWLVSQAL
jgi:hypothetical protein